MTDIAALCETARARKALSEVDLMALYEHSRFADFRALEDDILLGDSPDGVKALAFNLAKGAAIRRLS